MDTLTGLVGYAARQMNPSAYATDSMNQSLTEKLVDETKKKSIAELNKTIIKNGTKDHTYPFDMGKRTADKTVAIIQTLVAASLEENPLAQDPETIETILRINPWLITDLHYLVALKALETHRKQPLLTTPYATVDVLLHKISVLPEEQKQLLMLSLLSSINPVTKTTAITDSLATVPDEQLDALMATIKAKKTVAKTQED